MWYAGAVLGAALFAILAVGQPPPESPRLELE
jgi:hypothetical protein